MVSANASRCGQGHMRRQHSATGPAVAFPFPIPNFGGEGVPCNFCSKQVFEEAFLHVALVAWQYLPLDSRRALRAASRNGRLLHDSLLTHLGLNLGVPDQRPMDSDNEEADAAPLQPPTPSELASYMSGVLQRGATLQALELRIWSNNDAAAEVAVLQRREEQL